MWLASVNSDMETALAPSGIYVSLGFGPANLQDTAAWRMDFRRTTKKIGVLG